MKIAKSWLIDIAICMMLGFVCSAIRAQDSLSESPHKSSHKAEAVEYLYPEQVTVPAGKPSAVALHFAFRPNLHINAHVPRAEYLIPLSFRFQNRRECDLRVPAILRAPTLRCLFDPSEKLLVYSGEFKIDAKIIAAPGDHLVEAKLHYQACDQNACMPPKTITVPIDVVGK